VDLWNDVKKYGRQYIIGFAVYEESLKAKEVNYQTK
jgi:hypothetical protein